MGEKTRLPTTGIQHCMTNYDKLAEIVLGNNMQNIPDLVQHACTAPWKEGIRGASRECAHGADELLTPR